MIYSLKIPNNKSANNLPKAAPTLKGTIYKIGLSAVTSRMEALDKKVNTMTQNGIACGLSAATTKPFKKKLF